MDDDLLADDGQFKDDGLDELDIDEENALLGLSDEDIENERGGIDQELEYVDEDGNIVDMRESNAELYEVANVRSSKNKSYRSSKCHEDDDILELDLDIEESFSQEDPDFNRSIDSSKFSSKDIRHKENLISIHRRQEADKLPVGRSELSHHSERDYERVKSESSYNSHTSRSENRNQYSELEFDEESEDENVEDDHRERFKSERSNIITLTPAKNRDIPDTLESVINVEESARVQAFLDNEQKRKLRWKNKGSFRGKGPIFQQQQNQQQHFQQQHHQQQQHQHQQQHQQHQQQQQLQQQKQQLQPQQQQLQPQQQQQQLQQLPQQQPPAQQQQPVVSRKILINPHFKGGPRLPSAATSTTTQILYPSQLVNVSSVPATTYEAQPTTYQPSTYSHQDTSHQVPLSTSNYNAPHPNIQYAHPDYPPQPHPAQAPGWPTVQTNVAVGHHYSDPNAMPAYLDPQSQNTNYQNSYAAPSYHNAYQVPPVGPHAVYEPHQAPPQMQHQSAPYAPPPSMGNVHAHMPTGNYAPQMCQVPQQSIVQQPRYQVQQNMAPQHQISQMPSTKYSPPQRFQRQPEKRTGNPNIRSVPIKQPRMENVQRFRVEQRKPNFHVNNANIREIPLVDTLPVPKKTPNIKKEHVEEEDEKTKELRVKIEEQKLLREQILKRKEERRRQMAAQRMQELNKRKLQQNNAAVGGNQNASVAQNVVIKKETTDVKPNIKERIGAPTAQQAGQAKKKIIVVRKKPQQQGNVVPNVAKTSAPPKIVPQKTIQPQNQKINIANKIDLKPKIEPGKAKKFKIKAPPTQNSTQPPTAKKTLNQGAPAKLAIAKKAPLSNEAKKKNLNQSSQNRGRPMSSPRMRFSPRNSNSPQSRMMMQRFPSPRGPEPPFRGPPFCDHRMGFPPNQRPMMNDMRMPHPLYQDHGPPPMPMNHREPLLQREPMPYPPHFYHPDGPPHSPPRFRMQGPGFHGFRPPRPDMFQERFPPPRFQNPMPPMRFEPGNQMMFQRPQFPGGPPIRHMSPGRGQNFNRHGNPNRNAKPQASTAKGRATDAVIVKKDKPDVVVTQEKPDAVVKPNVMKGAGDGVQQTDSQDTNASKTQTVMVENLSSCTNEAQLKKLCKAVGLVDNIELMKNERKAIIKFKEPSQAMSFQKKYQRYMLDLAMIQVSLLPS